MATNMFARKLSEAAIGNIEWNDFITRPGISYDSDKKVYVIDPLAFKRSFNQ